MAKKKDARPFWTGDCETDPFKHGRVPKPFIWGLYTGAGFHMFETVEEFVEHIRDCDVIIGFHNGGRFDLHFLLKYINLHEKITVINGRLVVAHIGKCELRDTYNMFPIPLAMYKKDEFDYTKLEEEVRAKHMPEIRTYLKNDCVYLYELVQAFELKYGRHLTQAGAAMHRWEYVSGRKRPKTDREFFDKFVKQYYGGRVQCFQKGRVEGPCNVYDIRSAYPDAMLSKHPYEPEYIVREDPSEFRSTSFLTVECRSRGALPFRDERGTITFPDDGEPRTYHVCGHELIAGMDTASVSHVRITECIDFMIEVDFSAFILPSYAERQIAKDKGDKANDILEKLNMNGLSGKFGANPDNYGNFVCVPFQEMEDYISDGYEFDGMIGPHALLRAPLDEWQEAYVNVATIASITSQARAKLWRALSAVKPENRVYCDTDSMIVRGEADLDIGKNLGQWQHEGTADTVYVGGKKLYLCEGLDVKDPVKGTWGPKMATKGARLTPQQIKNVCNRADMGHGPGVVLYEPEAPTFSLHRQPQFTDRRIKMT